MPKSAWREEDLATAKAASDICDLIESNNKLKLLAIREAYLGWTQGMWGGYVRYLVDKKFGTHKEPIMEMSTVKVEDDYFECPQCHAKTPEEAVVGSGQLACPQCSTPLDQADFHEGETAEVPVVSGSKTYPDGQEVISIYGALNLKVMPQANSQDETLYLVCVEEKHRAALRAAFPEKAKEIDFSEGSAEDTYERRARLQLFGGVGGQGRTTSGYTMPFSSLLTYKRAWLRPEAFWDIDDEEVRDELLAKLPDGARIDIAGKVCLRVTPEDMDTCWCLCMPMPGQGAYREPWGWSCLDSQKQFNNVDNLIAEYMERAAFTPIAFNSELVNGEALQGKIAEPGSFIPVKLEKGGRQYKLDELFHEFKSTMSENVMSRRKDMVEAMQSVSGAQPALWGGGIQHIDTASGYQQALNQTLGQYMLLWAAVTEFHSSLMLLAVECFRRNRDQDTDLTVVEKSGEFAAKYIRLDQLKGNILAEPEADDGFPSTWSETVDRLVGLAKNPQIAEQLQQLFALPSNAPLARRFIGIPELVFPLEQSREKQWREIDALLDGQSTPDPLNLNPYGIPSQPVHIWTDNHEVEMATIQEWCDDDKGITASKENPLGFNNVMAHFLAHKIGQITVQAQVQKLGMEIQAGILPPPSPQTIPGLKQPSGKSPSGQQSATQQQATPASA
ncbi:MAG TPA: hypothetical protein VNH83_25985 [Bryobacteraceae bacterium]|nr:hypothetical protein [Bryobacteraceae bacterium]